MSRSMAFIPATPGRVLGTGRVPGTSCSSIGQTSFVRTSQLRWMVPIRTQCTMPAVVKSSTTATSATSATSTVSATSATSVTTVKSAGKRRKVAKKKSRDNGKPLVLRRSGMNAAVVLSPALAAFVGHDMMIRRDLIRVIAEYVREHDLVVPGDKRKFVCDDTLRRTLGFRSTAGEIQFLHINKMVSPSLTKPADKGPQYEVRGKQMFKDYIKQRGALDSADLAREVDNRGKNSTAAQKIYREKGLGMFRAVYIDGALSKLCDGKTELSRPQILKCVWRHIKSNNLQWADNRRKIVVDPTLREALEIFDVEFIDSFHIGRYLWKLCRTKP